MLSLSLKDIQLGKTAVNKQAAITVLAEDLVNKGYVEEGYKVGMLARESQASTFLGAGIAIPHGTTDTRGLVKQTGVQLHHFPQGIDWGEGNTVYLAIAIAAKSDEHLDILKQLTKVLSADGVEDKLKHCRSADEIIALINTDTQAASTSKPMQLDSKLVQLNFPSQDLLALSAVAAGLLKHHGMLASDAMADIVSKEQQYLGQGMWLTTTTKGVKQSALAFITPEQHFSINEQLPVKGLLVLAAQDSQHVSFLRHLTDLIYTQKIAELFTQDKAEVMALLTPESLSAKESANVMSDDAIQGGTTGTFKIKNSHGLHARPSAMFVKVAKQFSADICVKNSQDSEQSCNAKNLMSLMSLGIKCGDDIIISAQGHDAEQAISALADAIKQGLGETSNAE